MTLGQTRRAPIVVRRRQPSRGKAAPTATPDCSTSTQSASVSTRKLNAASRHRDYIANYSAKHFLYGLLRGVNGTHEQQRRGAFGKHGLKITCLYVVGQRAATLRG